MTDLDLDALVREARRRHRRLAAVKPPSSPSPCLPPPPPGPRRLRWSTRSPYRGVYPTPEGRWAAKFRAGGRLHYCGTHDTPEAAADAVDRRAAEVLGVGGFSGRGGKPA